MAILLLLLLVFSSFSQSIWALTCQIYNANKDGCVATVFAAEQYCVSYITVNDTTTDVWNMAAFTASTFADFQSDKIEFRNLTGCQTDNCNTCKLPQVIGPTPPPLECNVYNSSDMSQCIVEQIRGSEYCVQYIATDGIDASPNQVWTTVSATGDDLAAFTANAAAGLIRNVTACQGDQCQPCPTPRTIAVAESGGLFCNSYDPLDSSCASIFVPGSEYCAAYVSKVGKDDVWMMGHLTNAAYQQATSQTTQYRNLTGCQTNNCVPCKLPRNLGLSTQASGSSAPMMASFSLAVLLLSGLFAV